MTTLSTRVSADEQGNEQELAEAAVNLETVKKRSVFGAMSYVFRSFFIQILALISQIVLSRYLAPGEYGVYFVITAFLGLFTFISDVGLASALIQKKTAPTLRELRTAFTVQQVLALSIFLIVAAIAPFWQRAQGLGGTEMLLLYALTFSFLISSLKTIPSILLERELRFDLITIPALLENLAFHILVSVLVWQGAGVESFTYAVLTRSILGVVVLYSLKRWPIGLEFDWKTFTSLLPYGAKFQLNDLIARAKDDLLIVFLSAWLGTEKMGYVGWAKRWSMLPYTLTVSSVMSITFPTFSRLQHNTLLLKKGIEKSLYFISLFTFPLLAGMALFLAPVLQVFPDFADWQPAVLSFVFFAANIGWSALSTPLTNALNAIGEINKTLKLMIFWTVLTWILTPLCVVLFGYTGVAVAAFLVSCTSVLTFWMVHQVVPLDFVSAIWRQLLATGVMIGVGLAGYQFWGQSLPWLLLGMLTVSASYGITFLTVGYANFLSQLASIGIRLKRV